MTGETFVKAQLAALAHREAAHLGGVDAMLAVAFVMRNRVRAGWHGGDWMHVINQATMFAAVICPPSAPDPREPAFRLLLNQIDDVYSGLAQDRMTEGALYYCELHRVERPWFRDNVLSNLIEHQRVATVANTLSLFR